jgi:transposase
MGSSRSETTAERGNGTGGVSDVVGEILRNATGEAVKGGSSVADTTKRVVSDAVETLDERGPELVQDAGIMSWRYALLGWATWKVGKFVVRRRLRKTAEKAAPTRRRAPARAAT